MRKERRLVALLVRAAIGWSNVQHGAVCGVVVGAVRVGEAHPASFKPGEVSTLIGTTVDDDTGCHRPSSRLGEQVKCECLCSHPSAVRPSDTMSSSLAPPLVSA